MIDRWGFAATSATLEGLPTALQRSLALELDRATELNATMQRQMEVASLALTELLLSGLWGRGSFTVSLSGGEGTLYLAVTSQ
jgi:hypothetical protein